MSNTGVTPGPILDISVETDINAIRQIKQAAGMYDAPTAAPAAAAPAAAPETAKPTKPGVERWPVKTTSDPDKTKIGAKAIPTSIQELRRAKRPADLPPGQVSKTDHYQDHRAAPTETTIWQMHGDVIEFKHEQDGDFHLVLQDASGKTMVAEVPDPNFLTADCRYLTQIKAARQAVVQTLGATAAQPAVAAPDDVSGETIMMPAQAFTATPDAPAAAAPAQAMDISKPMQTQVKQRPVIVTGVGFFDNPHGQDGGAPNSIELHPVIAIQFTP
jgi:hypothetical protein